MKKRHVITVVRAGYKNRNGEQVWHNLADLSLKALREMTKLHGQQIAFQYWGANDPFGN